MIWVDYCILAVALISLIVGALRGFTREIFSLLNWILAFGLAWMFGGWAADRMQSLIAASDLRTLAGYAACFFGGLLIGAILSMLLVEGVRNSRLASVDRTLGAGFGLMRALLLVAIFVLIADNMGARDERWRQRSSLITHVEWMAAAIGNIVPEPWLAAIRPEPLPESPLLSRQEG
jgi:membrane protein required for colicin V production